MSKKTSLADALAQPQLRLQPEPALPDPPGPAQARRPPSRRGLRSVAVYLPPEAHKQLRLLAVNQDRSLQDLAIEALDDLFQKHGNPDRPFALAFWRGFSGPFPDSENNLYALSHC